MSKAFVKHKNNTIPIIPHVNYFYNQNSAIRFDQVITTTRLPTHFVYLGGGFAASNRTNCAHCIFDGNLYTTMGRGDGSSNVNLHKDPLGDGLTKNDTSSVGDTPPYSQSWANAYGLVRSVSNTYPNLAISRGQAGSTKYKVVTFYDLPLEKWSSYTITLPEIRSQGFGGVCNNIIYDIGGMTSTTTASFKSDTTAINPVSGTVSMKASAPGSRALPASCIVDDRYVYVAGGCASYAGGLSSNMWRYDTVANSWTVLTPLPFNARGGLLCHNLKFKDRIYFMGSSAVNAKDFRNTIYYYSISANSWVQVPQTLPIACRALSGFCTEDGIFILFGFESSKYSTSHAIYAYDPDPYTTNPTSVQRPNALILYCNSLLGLNRRIRPIISSKITGNPYINLFAIREIVNRVPGSPLYPGSFDYYFTNSFSSTYDGGSSIPSRKTNRVDIVDYSVKDIGGMLKWEML